MLFLILWKLHQERLFREKKIVEKVPQTDLKVKINPLLI